MDLLCAGRLWIDKASMTEIAMKFYSCKRLRKSHVRKSVSQFTENDCHALDPWQSDVCYRFHALLLASPDVNQTHFRSPSRAYFHPDHDPSTRQTRRTSDLPAFWFSSYSCSVDHQILIATRMTFWPNLFSSLKFGMSAPLPIFQSGLQFSSSSPNGIETSSCLSVLKLARSMRYYHSIADRAKQAKAWHP